MLPLQGLQGPAAPAVVWGQAVHTLGMIQRPFWLCEHTEYL